GLNSSEFSLRQFDETEVKNLARSFRSASPFPHIVIDGVLTVPAAQVTDAFPGDDWHHWGRFTDEYQKEKRHCANLLAMPALLQRIVSECMQPPFLRFLENVTGIRQLTVDPYLNGGGLHCSGPGGVLRPHTDFHFNDDLHLYRMLNVLIYLNDNWSAKDGGNLELYRKGSEQPEVTVTPIYGRMVIFRTDDCSVHGFANPIANGKWRKSIALYYYRSRDLGGYGGDSSTHWQTHGPRLNGIRRHTFDGLMIASRGLSRLARIVNPDQS
ncbi:MAG TPA: 2OG-Fe(II) oxygenase, partial [Sphingobium sp.]|nr:2OG-Fe(II) oxygenase [Sphingobium sp.]